MSRAFVKESSESAPPPERMVPDGPNPVTAEGFAHITAQVARLEAALKAQANVLLRETLARDLRYWQAQQGRAEIAGAPSGEAVAFGHRVTLKRGGRVQRFRIVGEDEAKPADGLVSWRSPLAQAILGASAGEIVEAAQPLGEIEIVSVEA